MLSRNLVRPLGVAMGAGTALSAFGIAAPASATVDCTSGVTIDANEAQLRTAIDDGNVFICVRPGIIDLSSGGSDSNSDPISLVNQDLRLVALGDVTFDGGGDSSNAILASSDGSNLNLEIDGFTFTDFYNGSSNPFGIVDLEDSNGTLTVLNSTFEGNTGYSMIRSGDWYINEGDNAHVVVDGSVFTDNSTYIGVINGYSDVTVTNSTFIDGETIWGGAVAGGTDDPESVVDIHGNYFSRITNSDNSLIDVSNGRGVIYNNTFTNINGDSSAEGPVISVYSGADADIAFNTFEYNTSSTERANVTVFDNASALFLGNIFYSESDDAIAVSELGEATDSGGNFSNGISDVLSASTGSHVGVTFDQLGLAEPADNGGPTLTSALGRSSVALDAVSATTAADLLDGVDLTVDQRGSSRASMLDAGAWDDGTVELAATGVNSTPLVLAGGLLSGTGIAMVARRRRNRV